MRRVIPFAEWAVARLRERLGAVEEANQDLIAFARGHSGAVASIQEAVLAGIEADGLAAVRARGRHDRQEREFPDEGSREPLALAAFS